VADQSAISPFLGGCKLIENSSTNVYVSLLIRKIRILKIEKFAVELYDLNQFFAIFGDFFPKIQ